MVDWRRERDLFYIATAFLTRIPIPAATPHSPSHLNDAARYFPLVGMLVGTVAAAVYGAAIHVWPPGLAIALSMTTTLLLTGAFHEDGLADSCDGFGGGFERGRILAIMKDSRLGTYGALGLMAVLGMKFLALQALDHIALVGVALIVGHTWSRLLAVSYLNDLEYVRDEDSSKVKPLATALNSLGLRIAAATTLPLLLLISLKQIALIAVALLLWRWYFRRYLQRRLGGYTGDCLGAAQQIAEVLIYLALVAS